MDTTASTLGSSLNSASVSQGETAYDTVRYHYLDNLRALALLAGILFHVGIGFNVTLAGVWPTANEGSSMVFDYWTTVMHTFRMPLFFLIAGFFAHYLVQKRGVGGFVKNRALRVALPFVIFWPLMVAAIIGLFIYAAKNMDVGTPTIEMIRLAMENPEAMAGQEPPLSTTHLWFIYYLSIFCFITAAVAKWIPNRDAFYRVLSNPWMLLAGLPAISYLVIAQLITPYPAPESFIPVPWALAFFGLFFTVGWVFFSRRELLEHLAKAWPLLAGSSGVAAFLLILNLPEPFTLETAMVAFTQPQALTPDQIIRGMATAVLAWHLTFLSLLARHRLLNRRNAVLRYMADGSYWVYIAHLPIVFYLQFAFHSIDLPLWVEFIVISSITLAVGYVSYALLVRRTPVGWLLNGRRKRA